MSFFRAKGIEGRVRTLLRDCGAAAVLAIVLAALATAQAGSSGAAGDKPYVLGPGDQLTVQVPDVEEFNNVRTLRIDDSGSITIPLAGRVAASGLTTQELETAITTQLSKYVIRPVVTVSIVERRTHPVTVTGAVKLPGVMNLTEGKTLYEAVAQAGGVLPESGPTVRLTRRAAQGDIPLPGAGKDTSGDYFVVEIPVRELDADSRAGSIPMLANDVITVSRAEMIYVIGDVKKAGPFALTDGQTVSVLQAIGMAEGALKTAATSKASIKRPTGQDKVLDIPVDIDKIMAGKSPDVKLQAKDILIVPGSASKSALERTVTTILAIGTGAAIRLY